MIIFGPKMFVCMTLILTVADGHQEFSQPLDIFFNKETENEVPIGSSLKCELDVNECLRPVTEEMSKCYLPMIANMTKVFSELLDNGVEIDKDLRNWPHSAKKVLCCSRNVAELCTLDVFAAKLSKSCFDKAADHIRRERTQMQLFKVLDCNTRYFIGSEECN